MTLYPPGSLLERRELNCLEMISRPHECPEGTTEISRGQVIAAPGQNARKLNLAPAGAAETKPCPPTHLSLHYHVVFSTKERRVFIDEPWRERLHAYLGGAVRTAGGVPEALGGVGDHVHLLMGLRATHRLADVVRDIKAASSEWVHQEIKQAAFSWQEGYGAFTVSASQLDVVKQYIANQSEHHQKKSFQEEYREMLVKSGVEFNEKYLW